MIILEKVGKKKQLIGNMDKIVLVQITKMLGLVNFADKYI